MMRNSNVHAILSEMFRLLSEHSASDFKQASEYVGPSRNLREALGALALEAERTSSASGRHTGPSEGVSVNKRGNGGSPVVGYSDDKTTVLAAIRRSLDSNSSILEFARAAGLKLVPRPKESRDRLSKRLADAILIQSESKRSQIMDQLNKANDQTQGWLGVIKSNRL